MKLTALQAVLGSALILGTAQSAVAEIQVGHRVAHQHYGKRSSHNHGTGHGEGLELRQSEAQHRQRQEIESFPAHSPAAAVADDESSPVKKRAVCTLPTDADLVSVPGASNGGWAIAPDKQCTAGSWCPIACVSGKVMAQWKPHTSYTYPESMDGGLYCDEDGTPKKSFESDPYCVDGTGTVSAVNKCGEVISFCQTVLPGDEGMYIPTDVSGTTVLAVPGPSYWASTAAHYYINPPGTSGADGCIWGTSSNPIGNWAPYVAGANTDSSGETYVKIGWNPIYTGSGLSSTKPTFGLRIECSGSGCNGLPCSIDADNMDDFSVSSSEGSTGAGVYSTSARKAKSIIAGGIFHENGTATAVVSVASSTVVATTTSLTAATSTEPAPASTTSSKNEGSKHQGGAAVVGLLVAVVASLWLC
ncbi:sun domain containing protein [Grosmannia clavigera kw1407]|uniref:Sun domain containing protein n=1 Tax=Grosmannia clavigera (strain kw1407 / UAMH 11150) TaxID=655863 RepID=F0XFW3_GROCL|nr:sun domain containing protein [Grosmannia clavigera kw1407]EFX04515.1 sun domain containing protein [Grosmannia clavigera kw1407]